MHGELLRCGTESRKNLGDDIGAPAVAGNRSAVVWPACGQNPGLSAAVSCSRSEHLVLNPEPRGRGHFLLAALQCLFLFRSVLWELTVYLLFRHHQMFGGVGDGAR
jgi:hypothetical protein